MLKDEIDIENVISLLIEGKKWQEIADILSKKISKVIPLTTLFDFANKSEFSARVDNALKISADTFVDKAESALKDAPSNLVEVQRAKELAQFYMWKAGKRNPKTYSNNSKIDLNHSGDVTIRKVEVEIFKTKDGTTDNPDQGK